MENNNTNSSGNMLKGETYNKDRPNEMSGNEGDRRSVHLDTISCNEGDRHPMHLDAISCQSSQSRSNCRSSISRLSLASKLSSKQNAEFECQKKNSELNEMRTRAEEEACVESEME